MDCLTFRMNEDLIGRLVVAKCKGTDSNMSTVLQNNNIMIQSTILPDLQFTSVTEWLNYIKQENAAIERQNNNNKLNREIMEDNLKYHEIWLSNKFFNIL